MRANAPWRSEGRRIRPSGSHLVSDTNWLTSTIPGGAHPARRQPMCV